MKPYYLSPEQKAATRLFYMDLYRPWFVITAAMVYQWGSTNYHDLDLSGSPRYPQ